MKTVNLKSLIEIYEKNGSKNLPLSYENYLGCKIKEVDLKSLNSLINTLFKICTNLSLKDFNGFYTSYEIPQIGKEFDLLRLTKSKILNIEYKSEFTNTIEKQLQKNYYYLKFLNKEIYSYTFVDKTRILYKLDDNKQLVQADFLELINIIKM